MKPRSIEVEHGFFTDAQISTPEQRLMGAVIERAILDVIGEAVAYPLCDKALIKNAHRWIFNRKVRSKLSFDCCCEAINLNPDEIRSRILDLCQQGARLKKKK